MSRLFEEAYLAGSYLDESLTHDNELYDINKTFNLDTASSRSRDALGDCELPELPGLLEPLGL